MSEMSDNDERDWVDLSPESIELAAALMDADKRIALLEKVAEAVMEFNGSSGLASVRAWNAVKAAMLESGYNVTKEHIL